MARTSYQREKTLRQMAWLRDLKTRPCAECGLEFPWFVMTFDHVPERGPKLLMFGHTQRGRFSWAELREEVAKCEIVCANCQAIRTYRRMEMPGSQGEGDAVQEFTRAMRLTQDNFSRRVDPNHPFRSRHQCPRCHLKFTRSSEITHDNSTYWQHCCRECALGIEKVITLRITGPGAIPNRAYEDDCGLDLFTYCPDVEKHFPGAAGPICKGRSGGCYWIPAGKFADIDCGIEIQLPEGVWGLITGRSSAIRKKGLLVPNGIIDTGYRGRLFMPVQNLSGVEQHIEYGERIGQLILLQNVSLGVEIQRVEALDPSDRGEKGRGSTGK